MAAYDLSGKVALVTGAERGIGLAVARALHERGAAVTLVDLDAEATATAAAGVGERTLGLGTDVTDAGAVARAVEATVERFGSLDVCVANAGIAPAAATVRAMEPTAFELVVEVNLLGAYRTVHAALPHVVERRGHVALVGSVYAFFNGMMMSPYAVSKAGVEQLARALRVELAPLGASAGVVFYGFIATEMVRQSLEDPLVQRFEQERIPRLVRRRLTPEQAAEALVRGVERRSARVFAPAYLRPYSALRGILNPLIDTGLERDRVVHRLLSEADAGARAEQPEAGGVAPPAV